MQLRIWSQRKFKGRDMRRYEREPGSGRQLVLGGYCTLCGHYAEFGHYTCCGNYSGCGYCLLCNHRYAMRRQPEMQSI
jgi:hypothetical protein